MHMHAAAAKKAAPKKRGPRPTTIGDSLHNLDLSVRAHSSSCSCMQWDSMHAAASACTAS